MAITTTLVLSTFTLGNTAFAVEQGDKISFKGKANNVTIQPNLTENIAKAKAKIQFTVNQVQESTYDGFGRLAVVIDFKGNQDIEPIVIPPTNSFTCQYDDVGNILTILETQVQSESGDFFILSGTGSYNLDKKDKSRADITLNIIEIESQDRFKIPLHGSVHLGTQW